MPAAAVTAEAAKKSSGENGGREKRHTIRDDALPELHMTVLYCTVLYYAVLSFIALYCKYYCHVPFTKV